MKRILLSLGLLSAFAVQASAQSFNLTITNPQSEDFGVIQYGTNYNVYGTIVGVQTDVTGYTYFANSAINPGSPATGFSFTPSTIFTNYINSTTKAEFGTVGSGTNDPNGNGGGLLGTIRLFSTATMGTTYRNVLTVYDTTSNVADGENLTATAATPEPASFAALGVGAVALLRRRRKA